MACAIKLSRARHLANAHFAHIVQTDVPLVFTLKVWVKPTDLEVAFENKYPLVFNLRK